MTFGEKLKAARIESGLKQSELAKKLNTTGNTISNWENNVSKPDLDTLSYICGILHVTASYFLQATIPEDEVSISELKLVKKYRYITEHSPSGAKTINAVLENEYAIAEQLEKQKDRIEELETSQAAVIDIQPHLEDSTRLIEYHHSASAGTGVFILGSEGVEQLPIPNTPENRKVDYAIKVSGNSMEPDYSDGDIVLVSQKVDLKHGDVGIFIVNNDAYIKEYGETELISWNPDADNIIISEYDNIVCMGKVVGKY